jgi:hypothetical protein
MHIYILRVVFYKPHYFEHKTYILYNFLLEKSRWALNSKASDFQSNKNKQLSPDCHSWVLLTSTRNIMQPVKSTLICVCRKWHFIQYARTLLQLSGPHFTLSSELIYELPSILVWLKLHFKTKAAALEQKAAILYNTQITESMVGTNEDGVAADRLRLEVMTLQLKCLVKYLAPQTDRLSSQ